MLPRRLARRDRLLTETASDGSKVAGLLQLRRDLAEFAAEIGANRGQDAEDDNRNQGSDETVFDGGRSALITNERC